jgi:hypothetical protein
MRRLFRRHKQRKPRAAGEEVVGIRARHRPHRGHQGADLGGRGAPRVEPRPISVLATS